MAKDEVIIKVRVLRWGNSYGFRIQKADLKRLGLLPGSEALVRLERRSGPVDLSGLPTFKGGMPDDSLRHDELLGQARQRAIKERKA
ncbi:MAG: hypothetical protein ACE5QW_09190 [Thermoplasmata archaeon]